MNKLDVPEVFEMPRLGPIEEDPVAFADMMLTDLLGREAGVLHAEYRDPEPAVGWFITPLGWRGEQSDPAVAVSPSGGAFRSVVARFGTYYVIDDHYTVY